MGKPNPKVPHYAWVYNRNKSYFKKECDRVQISVSVGLDRLLSKFQRANKPIFDDKGQPIVQ